MSSPDFNIFHIRNTMSYNPDGSYVSSGYIFTVSTNGRQLWTNSLNLNNLSASTLTLQSTLSIDNLVVGSTLSVPALLTSSLGASTLLTSSLTTSSLSATSIVSSDIGFSTLTGSSFVVTSGSLSSLTTSTLLTGNMNFSTLLGSSIISNYVGASSFVGSSLDTTSITTSALGVSTLTGSSLNTTSLTTSTLTGSSLNTTSITTSTLTGSSLNTTSITTSAIDVSTLTGSSLNTTSIITSDLGVSTLTGSTIIASGLTFSAADFSTMIGSSMYLNMASISSLTISSIIAPNGFGSTGPTGAAGSGGGGGGGDGTGYTGPTGIAGGTGETAVVSRRPTVTQAITSGSNQLVIWDTLDASQSIGNTSLIYSAGLFTNNSAVAIPLAIDYTIILNTTGSGSSYIGLNGAANAYGVLLNDNNIFTNSFTILLTPGSSFGIYYNDNGTPVIQTTSRITVSRLIVGQEGPTGPQGGNTLVAVYSAYPSATQTISASTETLLLWNTQDLSQSQGQTGLTYLNGVFTNNNAGTLPLLVEYQVLLDTTSGGATYVKLNGTTNYGSMLTDNNSFTNSFVVLLPAGQTLGVYYMDNTACVVQTASRISVTLLVSGLGQTGAAGYVGADGATGPTGYLGLDGPTGATGIQGPVGQVASLYVKPTVTQNFSAGVNTLTLWGDTIAGQTVGAIGLSYSNGLFTNTTASQIPLLVEYTIITDVTGTGSSYVSAGGASYGPVIHTTNVSSNSFTVFLSPGADVGVYYVDNSPCVLQTTSRLRLSVLTAGQAGPTGATGMTGPVGQVATLSAQPSVTQSIVASTVTAIRWASVDTSQSANQTGLLYSTGTGLFTNTTLSWIPVLVEYSVYLDTSLGGYSFVGVNGSTSAFGGMYNDSNWFSNSYTVLVPAGQTVGVYYTDNTGCVVQTDSRIRLTVLTAGAQGATGWTGVTGPAGYIGLDGATGSTGIQGMIGATGPTGIQGMTGPIGQVSILSQQPLVTQNITASTLTTLVWGSTDATQSSGSTGLIHSAGLYTNTTASTLPVLVEYTVYLNVSQGGYTFIGLNGSTTTFGGMYTSSNWFCNSYTVLVPVGQTVGVYYIDNGACVVQTASRIRLTVLTAGPMGPTGPTGITGPTGPTGLQGLTGPTGLMIWQLNGSDVSYSAGNVGVGVTNPNAPLQVFGAPGTNGVQSVTSNTILSSTSGSYDIVQRWFESTGNSNFVDLTWLRTSAGADWNSAGQRFQSKTDVTWQSYIQFNGTDNGHGLSFGTGSSTVSPSSVTEKMRIDSAGNVGIGITNPDQKFMVSGGNGFFQDGYSVYVGATSENAYRMHHTGNDSYLDYGTGKLVIRHNNGSGIDSTPMEFFSTGNVAIGHWGGNLGVGTSSPGTILAVNGGLSYPTTTSGQCQNYTVSMSASRWYKMAFIPDFQAKCVIRIQGTVVGGGNPHASSSIDVLISPDNVSSTIYPKIIQNDAYNGMSWSDFGIVCVFASGGMAVYVKSSVNSLIINLSLSGTSKNGSASNCVFYKPDSNYSLAFGGTMTTVIDTSLTGPLTQFDVYTNSNLKYQILTTDGSLGVGTANPLANLHVYGANGMALSNTQSVNYSQTALLGFNFGGGAGTGTRDGFRIVASTVNRDNGAGPFFDYGAQSHLIFQRKTNNLYSGGANDMTYTEVMRIHGASGNVGIGTNNPDFGKLQVSGGKAVFGYISSSKNGIFIDSEDSYGGYPCIQGVTSSWGAESIQINPAGGNVGIGTTNPGAQLHLYQFPYTAIHLQSSGVDYGYVGFSHDYLFLSANYDPNGGIIKNVGRANSYIRIGQEVGSANIMFGTSPTNNVLATERMRITGVGNVGIGTNNPTQRLDVLGSINVSGNVIVGGTVLPVTSGSVWATSGTNIYYSAGNVGVSRRRVAFSNTPEDANHSIYNNYFDLDGEGSWDGFKMNVFAGLNVRVGNASGVTPTSALYIDNTGNVGIGTMSPSKQFQLNVSNFNCVTGTQVYSAAFLGGSYGQSGVKQGTVGILLEGGTHYGQNTSLSFSRYDNVSARVEIMRLGEFGGSFNVGIGTTNPSYQFQLSTDSAAKPGTNTWTIASDERLKTAVELADTLRCYDIVKSVPLKRYTWREEVYTLKQVKDRSKLGWIAQDVEQVFPKAVGTYRFTYNQKYEEFTKDDGTIDKKLVSEDLIEDCRDLNADQMYAAMYGALQEVIKKGEQKDAEISALTSQLAQTQSQLTSLLAWAQGQGFSIA